MNGVKQGGVLSPVLFCVYMDDLLTSLKCAGYGCYAGHVFVGALAYADDIVLLAPTQHAMRCMLKVCEEYANGFDVRLMLASLNVLCAVQGMALSTTRTTLHLVSQSLAIP